MSSSGSGSGWLYKTAAIAAAAGLLGMSGYVLYRYVFAEDDEPDEAPVSMQALLTGGAAGGPASRAGPGPALPVRKTPAAPKPKGAGPSLPTRKPPSPAPKPAGEASAPSSAPTSASANDAGAGPSTSAPAAAKAPPAAGLKACACCSAPLKAGGLPQRCGQCKSVYYCSQACQKKHWPEHKPSCAKGGKPDAGGRVSDSGTEPSASDTATATPAAAAAAASPTASDAASQPAAAAPAPAEAAADTASSAAAADGAAAGASSAAADAGAGGSGGSAEGDGGAGAAAGAAGAVAGGLQGALVEVLRQAAAKGAGTLDGAFEEAVMHFLGGNLQAALAAFTSLQAAARREGRTDLVLELHKWLGHTNTKLGNFNAAADAFRAGIEEAKKAGNAAAQVDNGVGLGNLWKMAGQLTQASTVLKEALQVAQAADDAGMQSEVLVALGNVVMTVDPEEGLGCLQIAIKLREDEVAKAAETGDRAAMATGMMQAAAAMVNMAAALFATRRFQQAKQAYEQAMEIFELMEDQDKVIQVLINLANLCEMQLGQPDEARDFRRRLASALKEAGHPGIAGGAATTPCGVCSKPITIDAVRSADDKASAMVILGCLHVQHEACFEAYSERAQESLAAGAAAAAAGGEQAAAVAAAAAGPGVRRTAACPTCSAPVPMMS